MGGLKGIGLIARGKYLWSCLDLPTRRGAVPYDTLEQMLAAGTHYGMTWMHLVYYRPSHRRDCTAGTPGLDLPPPATQGSTIFLGLLLAGLSSWRTRMGQDRSWQNDELENVCLDLACQQFPRNCHGIDSVVADYKTMCP